MGDPFAEQDEDPILSIRAAKRQAILKNAAERGRSGPFNPSTIPPPPPPPDNTSSGIWEAISRFLHPGQQTTPATPKRNLQGIEDETK